MVLTNLFKLNFDNFVFQKFPRFHFDEALQLGPYNKSLKCFPVVMMSGKERKDVDRGGKS